MYISNQPCSVASHRCFAHRSPGCERRENTKTATRRGCRRGNTNQLMNHLLHVPPVVKFTPQPPTCRAPRECLQGTATSIPPLNGSNRVCGRGEMTNRSIGAGTTALCRCCIYCVCRSVSSRAWQARRAKQRARERGQGFAPCNLKSSQPFASISPIQ